MRHQLAASDYHEVINFSFVEEAWEADFAGNAGPIRLLNPIASQLAVMRSSLIGSLVANVRHNLNRKISRIRVFEVGRVYLRDPAMKDGDRDVAGVRQPTRIGAIAYGPALDEQWGERDARVDFFDVKGDVEALLAPAQRALRACGTHPALHPGRAARVMLDGRPIGWIGELHPRWQRKYELPSAPVLFELDAAPVLRAGFAPLQRSFALSAGDSGPGGGGGRIRARAGATGRAGSARARLWCRSIRLFDVYRGKGIPEGQKSLAFRVVMQDTAKTLTDGEADAAMAQLTQVLAAKFGARLRA